MIYSMTEEVKRKLKDDTVDLIISVMGQQREWRDKEAYAKGRLDELQQIRDKLFKINELSRDEIVEMLQEFTPRFRGGSYHD